MNRIVSVFLILLLLLPALRAEDKPADKDKPATSRQQYDALVKEFQQAQQDFSKAPGRTFVVKTKDRSRYQPAVASSRSARYPPPAALAAQEQDRRVPDVLHAVRCVSRIASKTSAVLHREQSDDAPFVFCVDKRFVHRAGKDDFRPL